MQQSKQTKPVVTGADAKAVREAELERWEQFIVVQLQGAMLERELTYPQLAQMLTEAGFPVDGKTLANRLKQGRFPMALGMKVFHLLGMSEVPLPGKKGLPAKLIVRRKNLFK